MAALASAPTWYSQAYGPGLTGSVHRSGGQAAAGLLPLALVGLAGIAAILASRGWLRRLVGVVLAGVGGILLAIAVSGLVSPPATAGGDTPLPVPHTALGAVAVHPFGPVLAAVGGLVMVAGGGAVMAGLGARRIGQRFESGQSRARLSRAVGDADDASQWWKAMDHGLDPTAAQAAAGPAPMEFNPDEFNPDEINPDETSPVESNPETGPDHTGPGATPAGGSGRPQDRDVPAAEPVVDDPLAGQDAQRGVITPAADRRSPSTSAPVRSTDAVHLPDLGRLP